MSGPDPIEVVDVRGFEPLTPTAHAVAGNGFVMLVGISCGHVIHGMWRTKLEFISFES